MIENVRQTRPGIDDPARLRQPAPIRLTYESTRAATWRCHLYFLCRQPAHAASLYLMSLLMALALASEGFRAHSAQTLLAFPFVWVLAYTAWVAYLGLLSGVVIRQTRFPRRDVVRICTTTLGADGFTDRAPEKEMTYTWRQVGAIREYRGDIYFFVNLFQGNFIPREAFKDRAEARRFHRAAVALWKGRGLDALAEKPDAWRTARDTSEPDGALFDAPDAAGSDRPDGPLADYVPVAAAGLQVFLLGCIAAGAFAILR